MGAEQHLVIQSFIERFRDQKQMAEKAVIQSAHTVADALMRALAHAGYHVGQIVQLSRFMAKDRWTTLTIPRGGSRELNAKMRENFSK